MYNSNQLKFKLNKPKGKWKSFDQTYIHILLKSPNKGLIGSINEISHLRGLGYDDRVEIMFKVKNDNKDDNCLWKNIVLKKKFKDLESAKTFVIENIERISNTYELFPEEIELEF